MDVARYNLSYFSPDDDRRPLTRGCWGQFLYLSTCHVTIEIRITFSLSVLDMDFMDLSPMLSSEKFGACGWKPVSLTVTSKSCCQEQESKVKASYCAVLCMPPSLPFPGHIGHIPPPGMAVLGKDNYKLKEILQYSGYSLSFQSSDCKL